MPRRASKTTRLLRQMKSRPEKRTPIGTDIYLPNNSGDHPKGLKRNTPVLDIDLVNKKYVDDSVAAHTVKLNEVENPDASKTFNLGNNKFLTFTSVDRTPIADEGIFNWETSGNFTGDLCHIHQHTGNAGPGTVLLRLEYESGNITPIDIRGGSGDVMFQVDNGGNVTVSGRANVGDGTAAAPSLSFHNDANTGFYSDTPATGDRIGITAGGTVQAIIAAKTLYMNAFRSLDALSLGVRGAIADGATAIGVKIANATALTTAGAKICSFYSDSFTTEKAYIDKDGVGVFNTVSTADIATNTSDVANLTTSVSAVTVSLQAHEDDASGHDNVGTNSLNISHLDAGIVVNQPLVIAYRAANQSIPNNTYTDAIFSTEVVDAGSQYNNTNGVFTANTSGYFYASWHILSNSAAWTVGEHWFTKLSKNNTTNTAGQNWGGNYDIASGTITRVMSSGGGALVYLAEDDTLRVKIHHDQGAALNTTNNGTWMWFTVHRVG